MLTIIKGHARSILIVLALVGLYSIYSVGYNAGFNNANTKFADQSAKLEKSFDTRLQVYRNESDKTINDLQKSLVDYKARLAFLNGNWDSRLLKSEQRADLYRKQAEASEAKRRDLAKHTARLDKSVTEGVSLVEELSALVRFRDKQLNTCNKLLEEERTLHGIK